MSGFSDPIDYLADADPGTVLYAFANDEDLWIEYLIRETNDVIAQIQEHPELQIRAGTIEEGGVHVVVVALGFAGGRFIFPSFWNYFNEPSNPDDGNIFDHMADGDNEIAVKFVGDRGKVRGVIPIRHPLGGFFQKARANIQKMVPWHEEDFRAAVWSVMEECGTPTEIWNKLGA